jgi:hypothetical protein
VTPTTVERRSHARFSHQFEIEGPQNDNGTDHGSQGRQRPLAGASLFVEQDYPEMTRLAVRLMLPTEAVSKRSTRRSGGRAPQARSAWSARFSWVCSSLD